jgi:hypothetical protein
MSCSSKPTHCCARPAEVATLRLRAIAGPDRSIPRMFQSPTAGPGDSGVAASLLSALSAQPLIAKVGSSCCATSSACIAKQRQKVPKPQPTSTARCRVQSTCCSARIMASCTAGAELAGCSSWLRRGRVHAALLSFARTARLMPESCPVSSSVAICSSSCMVGETCGQVLDCVALAECMRARPKFTEVPST